MGTEIKPLFRDLTAEDPDPEVTEVESLCMNCHANGMTRILLTRIPYYKNVILMSFSCEECGFENNEIQPGGAYAEKGIKWTLQVKDPVDLNRQVVKSDYTSVSIPELELEIPAQSQKGEVTTVEGVISRVINGLTQDQANRQTQHPDEAKQIEEFLAKLTRLRSGEQEFTLILEDISGNSFIENPEAPHKDPRCERVDFKRTTKQDHLLGMYTQEELTGLPEEPQQWGSTLTKAKDGECTYEAIESDEIMSFKTNCPECNAPADTNMKVTRIPHFKEVVIMATTCDACGHRTNEVKSGGGIEEKGVKIEIKIRSKDDFSRDVLKSETCTMSIPELDLEVGGHALGGRFSTVEGLVRATIDQLQESPGIGGDAPALNPDSLLGFIEKLKEILENKREVTVILDDPAGNSYVQSLNDDPELPDDGLIITRYERSFEQNEDLGINDMKTENYEEKSAV